MFSPRPACGERSKPQASGEGAINDLNAGEQPDQPNLSAIMPVPANDRSQPLVASGDGFTGGLFFGLRLAGRIGDHDGAPA
jgi:hypothetical protein